MNPKQQRVIHILFRSFYGNGSTNFVLKQDSKKDDRLRLLLEYSYFQASQFGKVYLTEDENSCAIVLRPALKKGGLRSLWWDIKLAFGCIGIFRIGKVMKRESLIHKEHPKEDFMHLWYIGVEPNQQGKGLGTALMEKIINEAKEDGLSIYLETSMSENYPFYEKLGFKEIQDFSELGYSLKMFCLEH